MGEEGGDGLGDKIVVVGVLDARLVHVTWRPSTQEQEGEGGKTEKGRTVLAMYAFWTSP
jgi:hypothetical protein